MSIPYVMVSRSVGFTACRDGVAESMFARRHRDASNFVFVVSVNLIRGGMHRPSLVALSVTRNQI